MPPAAPKGAGILHHLAANLRRLRREAGLSQNALAERAGVSRRMLVGIEAGDSNVSLSTLDKIAHALGVLLPDLIVDRERPLESPVLAWTGERPGSTAVLRHAVPAARLAELWEWTLAPGETYESPADPQDWSEMVFVIAGRLRLTFPDRVLTIEAGHSAAYRTDRPIVFTALGEVPVRFLRNVVI
ncbi:XRE family transcriptional regulator [Zavarzinia compransoris]|nr:XRE family transcriptional regulator [Zavarzinia marina]